VTHPRPPARISRHLEETTTNADVSAGIRGLAGDEGYNLEAMNASGPRPVSPLRAPHRAPVWAILGVLLAACAPRTDAGPAPRILADVVIDPNAAENVRDNGDLFVHYAVPLPEADGVYTEIKRGDYTSFSTWETQAWGVRRWVWKNGGLVEQWTFASDWKPVPFAEFHTNPYGTGPLWEPVFQPASAGDFLWVPGARGTIFSIRKADGSVVARIDPFDGTADAHTFVAGPVAESPTGVYFPVIRLDALHPWDSDVVGSWLVRVAPDGAVSKVSYSALAPGAPTSTAPCELRFPASELPFPPSPDARPPTIPCGTQRAALDVTPAFAVDGTVLTVSRAHFNGRYGYLLALGPDLSPRWAASLRDRLHDGCNVTLPPTGAPGGCRAGATEGVDPATNGSPAGVVDDTSSSSPVAAPDGAVLYGANTRYNFAQGHLLGFGGDGAFQGAYGFGWDTTPVIHPHDGTYSIVLKENRYDTGSYCNDQGACPTPRAISFPADPDAYFVTGLGPDLVPEWRFRSVNTQSCTRGPDGAITCVDDHPHGFEFCVNRVAVDRDGTVYANSEDGNLYAIAPGGTLRQEIFLGAAVGSAYTPVALGPAGVYTQNLGHLIVVGETAECPAENAGAGARSPVCSAPAPLPAIVGRPVP